MPRRRIYCENCGRSNHVHRLYIKGKKTLKVDLSKHTPEAQAIIKAFNPRLERTSYQFIPIGYWCEFCGHVHIDKPAWINKEID